jgi:hypothetical protein
MPVKRISELNNAVGVQGTDLLAIVNGGETRKTTVSDLLQLLAASNVVAPCKVATTANVNLALVGLPTIDGILVQNDDRVLVWRQTNAQQNGIYLARTGAWVRATDFDETAEVRPGVLISVMQGLFYKQSIFQITNTGAVTVGTSNILVARVTGWQFNETTGVVSTNRSLQVPSLQVIGGLAKYDAERHAQYDARTLVDKGYVDTKVTAVDSPWIIGGSNIYYGLGNGYWHHHTNLQLTRAGFISVGRWYPAGGSRAHFGCYGASELADIADSIKWTYQLGWHHCFRWNIKSKHSAKWCICT